MQPLNGRQQDVDMTGLDLLNGADVQVHQFGQLLLGENRLSPSVKIQSGRAMDPTDFTEVRCMNL
jgi:hypothetical protein